MHSFQILSNLLNIGKNCSELRCKKREVLLVSFPDFAHFVFAIIIVSNESGVETILKEENPKVRIYNMSGCLLFEGLYSQAKLKQGVYIVLHNGKALKIIVK